ncbi:hypothetical protein QR680_005855 [Steinernema hermaphroditum]|uniref:Globin family profile domain-containing protein n=1 Tax=Steinernema hermaphroditum TaxID=289476 RepID=A0AA39HTI6_9BILA|nr:hypothetical protein QR680_005855 [Steinernema hermaphroditum]
MPVGLIKKLKKSKEKDGGLPEPEPVKTVDSRTGFDTYRDFYTLKNYWKAVTRNKDAGLIMMTRYLQENPDNVALYPKLKGVDPKMIGSGDINVENVAKQYVQVFDDVISSVEANPADATEACKRLNSVGKLHRVKVSGMESTNFQALEQPFLYMVSEVLQDRFNDKAEQLFKKFFQFCLQYLTEGFNG